MFLQHPADRVPASAPFYELWHESERVMIGWDTTRHDYDLNAEMTMMWCRIADLISSYQ